MKLNDGLSGVPINNITMVLKRNEAIELMAALEYLLQNGPNYESDGKISTVNPGTHYHLNDYDYAHEVTVYIEGD